MIEAVVAFTIALFARIVTGVRANWLGCMPQAEPRIYFANHSSHADFVLIWASFPPSLRQSLRPVAGADYWLKNKLRQFLGEKVFHAVLIDRNPDTRTTDPIQQMALALTEQASLLVFPEGTRNTGEEKLLPFKSGLYHLSAAMPAIELVPVWIENLNRVMPKGEVIPIPLLCTVTFGQPLTLHHGEEKTAFLNRCRDALLSLAPSIPS